MSRRYAPGAGREVSALSSSFQELQHLQGRLEYAQSLTRSIQAIGLQHTRANMASRALDQAHVPVRQSLDALQMRVHYARLETADEHRRLSQMRRHVGFEADQLSTLQDGIGEVRHRLREVRRDAEVSARLAELRRQPDRSAPSSRNVPETALPTEASPTTPLPRGLPMFDRLQSSQSNGHATITDPVTDEDVATRGLVDHWTLEQQAQQALERALKQSARPKLEDLPHPTPADLLRAKPARTHPRLNPKRSEPEPEPEPRSEPESVGIHAPLESRAAWATPVRRRRFNPLATSSPMIPHESGRQSLVASPRTSSSNITDTKRSDARDRTVTASNCDGDTKIAPRTRVSLPSAVVERSVRRAMVTERRKQLTQRSATDSTTGSATDGTTSTIPITGTSQARPRLECSICMEILTPSAETARNCATLPRCGHVFHRTCIAPWLSKNSCPLCRCPVLEPHQQRMKLHS